MFPNLYTHIGGQNGTREMKELAPSKAGPEETVFLRITRFADIFATFLARQEVDFAPYDLIDLVENEEGSAPIQSRFHDPPPFTRQIGQANQDPLLPLGE